MNGIGNCILSPESMYFFSHNHIGGKAEEVLPAFYERKRQESTGEDKEAAAMLHPDVIVVDPPRKGF